MSAATLLSRAATLLSRLSDVDGEAYPTAQALDDADDMGNAQRLRAASKRAACAADLNRLRHGYTLLCSAVALADTALVRELIAAGADTSVPSSPAWGRAMTPLQLAAERGALDVVRVLLDSGVSVHASVPGERATPLVLAATTGYGDVVRLLLEHGARFSDVDGSGRCFLEYAHVVLADAMLAAVRADATLLARVAVLDDFAVRMLCSPCAEAAELLVMALDRGAVVSDDDVSSACRSAHVDSIAVMVRRGYRPTLAALDLAAIWRSSSCWCSTARRAGAAARRRRLRQLDARSSRRRRGRRLRRCSWGRFHRVADCVVRDRR